MHIFPDGRRSIPRIRDSSRDPLLDWFLMAAHDAFRLHRMHFIIFINMNDCTATSPAQT